MCCAVLVQTALLAMHGHSSTTEHGLLLLRNLREVKNAGSFDSVGSQSGDDIAPHVKSKLVLSGLFVLWYG